MGGLVAEPMWWGNVGNKAQTQPSLAGAWSELGNKSQEVFETIPFPAFNTSYNIVGKS